jgi:alpha-tubulin suppressor-like RCC1 family protein
MNFEPFYSCTSEHMVFVTEDDTVHTLGNNYSNALGVDGRPGLDNILALPGKVHQVAAGEHHTLALLKDGTVYGWGTNKLGQLGLNQSDLTEAVPPTLVPLSTHEKIISVHVGARSSLFRTSDDRLLVCGELAKYSHSLEFPSPIQSLSCGWSHLLVITKDGSVYGFGDNEDGELCLPDPTYDTPTLLPLRDITAVACGTNFSVLLTSQGSLLASGYNAYGSLGLQHTISSKTPTPVTLAQGVVGVAAGGFHVFALMEDGGVLGWGWNCFQQIAPEIVSNVLQPMRVFGEDMKDGEGGKAIGREDKKVMGIGCSWRASWLITKDQSVYIFCDQDFGFQRVKYAENSGPIQKAPWKVILPSLKEEVWRQILSWVFLGAGNAGSFFSQLPVEVVFHMVGLLL